MKNFQISLMINGEWQDTEILRAESRKEVMKLVRHYYPHKEVRVQKIEQEAPCVTKSN